jgi:hypothetical protein
LNSDRVNDQQQSQKNQESRINQEGIKREREQAAIIKQEGRQQQNNQSSMALFLPSLSG